jgi:hypothetical protein
MLSMACVFVRVLLYSIRRDVSGHGEDCSCGLSKGCFGKVPGVQMRLWIV